MSDELSKPWPDVNREYFGFSAGGANVFCLDRKSAKEVERWNHVAAQVDQWRFGFEEHKKACAAERDAALARVAELEKENARLLPALIAAYRNAEDILLPSDDLQLGHRSGVRDVAVRMGVYDQFCTALAKEPEE